MSGQTTDEFKQKVAEIEGLCWYGVPNATDIWQPVDAGYAQKLKVLIRSEHYRWLDCDENAEKLYGVDNLFLHLKEEVDSLIGLDKHTKAFSTTSTTIIVTGYSRKLGAS